MSLNKLSRVNAIKKVSGNITYTATVETSTGGTPYTPGNGYEYRVFTGSGTFTVTSFAQSAGSVVYNPRSNVRGSTGNPVSGEVLVIANGGSGTSGTRGGAGGAGGVVHHPSHELTLGTPYTVTRSSNSVFGGLTALQGGPGACPGNPGGSGGGSNGHGGECGVGPFPGTQPAQTHPTAPTGWNNYGNPSGACSPTPGVGVGAGGGGAGGSGGQSSEGPGRAFPGFEGSLWGNPGNPGTMANGGRGGGGNGPSGVAAAIPLGGCGGSSN